jgi:hypothetical protein
MIRSNFYTEANIGKLRNECLVDVTYCYSRDVTGLRAKAGSYDGT